jgi:hypothetical protein
MTMNARAYCLICLASACLLASLAPPSKAAPEKKRSPYAGTFSGTFTAMTTAGDVEGEVTLTVDDDGNVTGESKNKTNNSSAKITGSILKDNKATIVFDGGENSASAFGTIAKTSTGGITGTMTQRTGTTYVGCLEFDLKLKAK